MKLIRLLLRNYRQFKKVGLDLTYPAGHERAGEPLEKVCFIGFNGAGKSTLLRIVRDIQCLFDGKVEDNEFYRDRDKILPVFETPTGERQFFRFAQRADGGVMAQTMKIAGFTEAVEEEFFEDPTEFHRRLFAEGPTDVDTCRRFIDAFKAYYDAVLYSVAEADDDNTTYAKQIERATLADALLSKQAYQRRYHELSLMKISALWNLLILEITEWTSTLPEIAPELRHLYPPIFEKISKVWDIILEPAGLFFDYRRIGRPLLSQDTLQAMIKLRDTEASMDYENISAGLRYFMFRIGQIMMLYHRKQIGRGLLLMDEPEGSLHAGFQYDLIDRFREQTPNTQIIVATHSPIIAAQFEPSERFILSWRNPGEVAIERSNAAEGNTPDTLLLQDFFVPNLRSRKGMEQYRKYIDLLMELSIERNATRKEEMITQALEIGDRYQFGKGRRHEVPEER